LFIGWSPFAPSSACEQINLIRETSRLIPSEPGVGFDRGCAAFFVFFGKNGAVPRVSSSTPANTHHSPGTPDPGLTSCGRHGDPEAPSLFRFQADSPGVGPSRKFSSGAEARMRLRGRFRGLKASSLCGFQGTEAPIQLGCLLRRPSTALRAGYNSRPDTKRSKCLQVGHPGIPP